MPSTPRDGTPASTSEVPMYTTPASPVCQSGIFAIRRSICGLNFWCQTLKLVLRCWPPPRMHRRARGFLTMRILHLEDNPLDAELMHRVVRIEWPDSRITTVDAKENFLAELQRGDLDVIVSDFSLISFSGLEGLDLARRIAPETPFIFFSGTIQEEV